jgi:hypothetical protein
MPSHKFGIGETVYVLQAISRNVPGGAYQVTTQLPHNGREFEYRVKSAGEEHERVMPESELTKRIAYAIRVRGAQLRIYATMEFTEQRNITGPARRCRNAVLCSTMKRLGTRISEVCFPTIARGSGCRGLGVA